MELYYIIHSLVLISCIFELATIKTKKTVIILWCIFFTMFGGLRWQIGGDWDQYYSHFLFSNWNNIFNYDRNGDGTQTLEPGFVFLNVLVKTIFGKFYFYNLIVVGFIQYTYYRLSLKFSPSRPLLFYVFLMMACSNYFPVRAGLAIAVSYWAYIFIVNRNLKAFLIVIFIATMIHNQSIVLLPTYWIGKIKLKWYYYLIIYLAVIGLRFVLQDYFILLLSLSGGSLAEKVYFYTQHETVGYAGANYIGWALNFVFLCIYLYIRAKKFSSDYLYNSWLNMFIIYNFIFICFSDGFGDLTRLTSSFVLSQVILFTMSMNYFIKQKGTIIKTIAIMFFILYCSYKISNVGSGYFFKDACVPYKTIFDYNSII